MWVINERVAIKTRVCDGIEFDEEIYEVGYFEPKNNRFVLIETFDNLREALQRVHYLNGGN